MEGNLELVYDLAVIFITAGITTLIFKILKQPLILGYIVAGLLVGPHLGLFPHAIGAESVEQWSEIGIIFLLFGLGLEFSFKKLLNVGSSALITAGTIFIGMFVTSIGLVKLIGWTNMECIFLGGMLSMSSTTIIIKAFDDLGMKKLPFTEVVFGTLVVEDLLAVILMVLLSTMAVSQKFAGGEMLWALLKLLFFIVLWFLVGMFVIPLLLKWGRKFFNDEMLTVLSIGLCFGMAIIANSVGFSSALGAFIMGSMLSETIEGERIERLTSSIKDLFGAVFFISVGMLVDPQIIIEFWKPILILILVVLTILPFFATTGVLLSGKGLHSAIRAGFSFAQIGEFAFIIASLGSSLGVISHFIYPVIVSVSVITTFTTPYYMKMAEPLSIWLSKKLPQNILSRLTPAASTNKTPAKKSEWKQLLTMYGIRIVTYSVLLIAIYIVSDIYLRNFITEHLTAANKLTIDFICAGITLAVMSPFIIGLIMSTGKQQELFQTLWNNDQPNKGILVALILLRIFIAVTFVLSVIFHYFHLSWWIILLLIIGISTLLILARKNIQKMNRMEQRFLENLSEKEKYERMQKPMTSSIKDKLEGYDIHIEQVTVSQNSMHMGKQLKDIPIRSKYGVNIIKITRGNKIINIPSANDYLYPGDQILVVGTENQIKSFMSALEASKEEETPRNKDATKVQQAVLTADSLLTNKSLKMVDMRNSGCMLIGIERGGEAFMNPSPDFIMIEGDTVWIIGEENAVKSYV